MALIAAFFNRLQYLKALINEVIKITISLIYACKKLLCRFMS